jgi:transcriptional regulator with XRE-family HTH domain
VTRASEIGARIRQARVAGGMTQRELADVLRVSEWSVIAYEAGDELPYRQMEHIAEATGKPVAWLYHGDETL